MYLCVRARAPVCVSGARTICPQYISLLLSDASNRKWNSQTCTVSDDVRCYGSQYGLIERNELER
jgi:hypothetical protein